MALGDNNYRYNGERREMYRPTVYGIALNNTTEQAIDKSSLSFSMWKSTIKISIAYPLANQGTAEYTQWDRDNAGVIYLTPTKASMFAEILERFIENPEKYTGYGVAAGKSLITISDGSEGNKAGHWCIIIRQVNTETGKCEKIYGYEIKKDYSVIYGYDNSGNYKKDSSLFENKELMMVIDQLKDYARNANNAIAFSVIDNMSWNNEHLMSTLTKIAEGVGVNLPARNGGFGGTTKSYFAGNSYQQKQQQSTASSMKDIDDF